ncbi:3-hydroxyacyl-CoA dehydrogenase family protein [Wukongibacter sp. M2B1]|uniref:3-hydroxyacyl-CoA dehydrogenase family protein n=1 Tax=Wukongibacter sp. M2B1 TaxID=3088895 RepID=UPI003D7994B9
MEIGIIGKGKMGREIFNHFFQYDYELVLICRKFEDIEGVTASVEKQLRKMLKRGYLTDSRYEEKKQSYTISNDLSALKDCDIVIESIYEDKELKKDMFRRLEAIVKAECILATNTSSIPLEHIFEKCIKKDRCLGIHFFFPVKLTKAVEINKTRFTEGIHVKEVRDILSGIDKRPIELKEEANMILNKILLTMITHIYQIYEENYLTVEEIDKVLKKSILTFGLFEIIDSTGISLILESVENFIDDRYRKLYTPFYEKGKELLREGYGGGPGNRGFIDYSWEYPKELKKLNAAELHDYKQNIILMMQSLLINELAFLVHNQYVDKDSINEGIKEVLGLSDDPISMLKSIGHRSVENSLLHSYGRLKDKLYKPLDLCIFNN